MVSSDVKPLIIKRIYGNNEIVTSITKNENMKEMLILCTKNVHFTFEFRIHVQTDVVAMGSPLEVIFMIELGNSLLPSFTKYAFTPTTWKRMTLKTLTERACVICSTD